MSSPKKSHNAIRRTRAWDGQTGCYAESLQRQADVCVFALLKHLDKAPLNPLDLDQWEFYVVATSVIEECCGSGKGGFEDGSTSRRSGQLSRAAGGSGGRCAAKGSGMIRQSLAQWPTCPSVFYPNRSGEMKVEIR
jgi:hypothetical protein